MSPGPVGAGDGTGWGGGGPRPAPQRLRDRRPLQHPCPAEPSRAWGRAPSATAGPCPSRRLDARRTATLPAVPPPCRPVCFQWEQRRHRGPAGLGVPAPDHGCVDSMLWPLASVCRDGQGRSQSGVYRCGHAASESCLFAPEVNDGLTTGPLKPGSGTWHPWACGVTCVTCTPDHW